MAACDVPAYELRLYQAKPGQMMPFMKLMSKYSTVLRKYNHLIGFWQTEIGGLNQVVHIWRYNKMAGKQDVTNSLGQDKEWINDFIIPAIPLLDFMTNEILTKVHWFEFPKEPPTGKNLYELIRYKFKPGGIDDHSKHIKETLTKADAEYTKGMICGVWQTNWGVLNSLYVLWSHSEPDTCRPDTVSGTVTAGYLLRSKDVKASIVEMESRLLTPVDFSPLQ